MDRAEFSANVEANRPKLMKIAKAMIRSSDCEDAVQSAIASAWEHLPQLRDKHAFDAWLVQILVNRCRQIQREYKKNQDIFAAMAGRYREEEEKSDLLEALDELGEEERSLILQHHHQGYTIREISYMHGVPEDVVKMRLYRARKHLRLILLSLLLLVLFACAAIGTGAIDVDWFLQNRRAEPAVIPSAIIPEHVEISYSGTMLRVEISDVVWNQDDLSMMVVYSIAGKDDDALVIHSGNIGVDGIRLDHIWTDGGILPVHEWADGKKVQIFTLDAWRLGGMVLPGGVDCIPDGRGETFMAELHLDWIRPELYESLLDANGMLTFETGLTLEDYESSEILEVQEVIVSVGAPTSKEWRIRYEAYDR